MFDGMSVCYGAILEKVGSEEPVPHLFMGKTVINFRAGFSKSLEFLDLSEQQSAFRETSIANRLYFFDEELHRNVQTLAD
jgi:hypothetical protein